ncbi:hypothetical protein LRP30_07030 [Bradyrhizobium sp. C-145]|nr:hypothetical protein [Bradyrhizobium sp. C-145]UQR65012.1 hypothetical protein LRP30_07030 [Bradyrhizobium sp. C-145]
MKDMKVSMMSLHAEAEYADQLSKARQTRRNENWTRTSHPISGGLA